MEQIQTTLSQDNTNHETSQIATAPYSSVAIPPSNNGFYSPSGASDNQTMVELNKNVSVHSTNPHMATVPVYNNFLPGGNSQMIDPAMAPYMYVTKPPPQKKGFVVTWEAAIVASIILLIYIGSILLALGLCGNDDTMVVFGIVLLSLAGFIGMCSVAALFFRRRSAPTVQQVQQYQP